MSNIYSTRSSFEIASNDELKIKLLGTWYRSGPIGYYVIAPDLVPHEHRTRQFDNQADALDYFEQLTA